MIIVREYNKFNSMFIVYVTAHKINIRDTLKYDGGICMASDRKIFGLPFFELPNLLHISVHAI